MHVCGHLGETRTSSRSPNAFDSGVALWAVNGTIGLKQVVDKFDLSTIEHVVEVGEDHSLLSRHYDC
jgi:hypothetical protein